ncbi:MAG: ribosome assembly RNA-binding protein YhbY [Bacilli bacterium]|nr:ribosome assembly RNA-binding protein YhbY [Bacilli bacterium]
MLTSKQKKYLKSEAHHLKAIFQIGKDGVHEKQIIGINEALEAQELIKVKLLDSCPVPVKNAALEISMYTKAEVVQIVGHTIVLYKKSDKELYRLP